MTFLQRYPPKPHHLSPPHIYFLGALISTKAYLTYLFMCFHPHGNPLRAESLSVLFATMPRIGPSRKYLLHFLLRRAGTHHIVTGLCQQVFLGERSSTWAFLEGLQEGRPQIGNIDTSTHFGGKRRRLLRHNLGSARAFLRQVQLLQGARKQLWPWKT